MNVIRYAYLDGKPVHLNDREAWWLVDGVWKALHPADAGNDAKLVSLCITCCSPSQPSHHAGCPARSRSRRKGDGFLVALALGHHGPSHSGDFVGERDGGDLGRPPR
jgi:hypothetical protein